MLNRREEPLVHTQVHHSLAAMTALDPPATSAIPPDLPLLPEAAFRPAWAQLEMFAELTDSAIANLQCVLHPLTFAAGAQIIEQGSEGQDMFILEAGAVRVSMLGSLHDTHFERVLEAPAVFGEMALVTNQPRVAAVHAEGPCHCLRLSRDEMTSLMQRVPQVGEFLTKAVGERLMESSTIQHVGKYRVLGKLGAGAAATVFEAVHPGLQRSVALKMLTHSLVYNDKFTEQFQQEAKLIASLNHDHIVRVFDTERAYGTHFIVMEKLTGLTLDDLIQQGHRLNWGTVRRVLREIGSALAYSHQRGLLHRDVKPSNVFLTDEDRRVKLLDFGIAVNSASSEAKAGEQLFGTPYYMSPEQILGQQLDGRSDMYSLGILAYELITGQVPFDAGTIHELMMLHLNEKTPDPRLLVADVPADLAEFVLRTTEKRAKDRFATCDEAVTFLKLATELPMVRHIELTTLAISYHPSRRAMVQEALAALNDRLIGVEGVAILHAHQHSLKPEVEG
jgi:serine/threonine protein kinase